MAFYLVIIIISFFASAISMLDKKNRVFPLLFFPYFLFLTILVELYADKLGSQNINNILVYNLFSLFEFIFYLFFFTYLFTSPLIKRIIFSTMILYAVLATSNIFFFQGPTTFHTYTYIFGCILIVALSVLYFYLLFRFPETGSLTKNPFFWIVAGLMFFHTCSFSYLGILNFITKTMQRYNWVLFFVQDILNVLLYTLFSIGFLCRINIQKLLALS